MADPYGMVDRETAGMQDVNAVADQNEAGTPGDTVSGSDDQFRIFKKWWQESRDKSRKWREEATEEYAFVAGHQWKPEDESYLREQLRPVVTFNRISVMMDMIAGMEVTNRQEVRYLPRQLGDVGVNELLTAAAKWFRDESNSEESESDAFLDTVICGMGWIDTRLDYQDNPDGTAQSERIDPLEMYWDSTSNKRNLKDRRYQIRAKRLTLTQAREMFPERPDEDLDAGWALDEHGNTDDPHNATEAKYYRNDQSGREGAGSRRLVTILEYQWWDREPFIRIPDPTSSGTIKRYDLPQGMKILNTAKAMGMPLKGVLGQRKVYKRAFVGGDIIEIGPSPYPDGFTSNPITAKRDRNKNMWYGLVRVMKDPQRWANKYLSTLQHYISTSGKGIIAEEGVFTNRRKAEEDWSKADSITDVRSGTISGNKIMPKPGGQIPQEVMGLLEFSIQSMRDVTGLNLEIMGMAEKEQPGILEYQRKQAGMTVLASLFDALRQFRKIQGEVLLYYIQNYFSDGRLIRIDGETGKQYIQLLRDQCLGEYDVIVDEATSSPNQKEAVWTMLMQLLPVIGKIMPAGMWGELVPYMPLPDSLTSKLKQLIIQQQQQPPQQDPATQAKMMEAQANLINAQSDAKMEPIKTQLEAERVKAQVESLKASALAALVKAGIQMSEPQLEVYQQALDGLIGIHGQAVDHQHKMMQAQQAHQHTLAQNAAETARGPSPGTSE